METRAYNGSEDSSTIFYLVGIPSLPKSFFLPIFFVFLLLYLLILLGNALILVAVVAEPSLHMPIYFFLMNLSGLRILFTIISKILSLLLLGDCFLSFPACFLQMYLFHSFSCSEAFILVVMAYDCYVAVCHPLHYPVLMTPQTNAALAACVWLTALLLANPAVVQTSHMAFDNTAHIYHCFCDHLAVV
ncbi:olfactory receptor olr37 [Lynx pardinus]|uniref:Olfactory receptor olr37 n=1 Tax=Lynx pardinus TaxID=191816 RepID=A0A485MI22_LYNPA|nr:olfactory receptor olr37 [Lynx pardinus]